MPPRLGAFLAVVFWGISFVATKKAVAEITTTKVLGLALGFAGALLVVTGGQVGGTVLALPSTRGDLLVLASTVNWAVYSVVGLPVLKRLGALRATAGGMLFAWLMLALPMAWAGAWADYARLTAAGWAAVLFLGIASSGLGYLFWYGALETIETSKVASLLYIEPLVTLVAAWLLLGERFGVTTIAGGALLLAGVALVQREV